MLAFPSLHHKILIAAIPGDLGHDELLQWLERVAPIADLRIIHGVGKPLNRRFAYADVHDPQDAERLVDQLNGAAYKGRTLRVYPAPKRPELTHAHDPLPIQ